MKALLYAAILMLPLIPIAGQSQQVNIFTFEDASCDAWRKSSGNKLLRAQYQFWIRGFVSGHNYATPSRQVEVGSLPGSDALNAYLDEYCKANPKSTFVGAAIMLVGQLRQAAAAPEKAAPKTPAGKPASSK